MSNVISISAILICSGAALHAWRWLQEARSSISTLQLASLLAFCIAAAAHAPPILDVAIPRLGWHSRTISVVAIIVASFLVHELIIRATSPTRSVGKPAARLTAALAVLATALLATIPMEFPGNPAFAAAYVLPSLLCTSYVAAVTVDTSRRLAPQLRDPRLRPVMRWGIRITVSGLLALAPALGWWHLTWILTHPSSHPRTLDGAATMVLLAICAITGGFALSAWWAFLAEQCANLIARRYTPAIRRLAAFLTTGDRTALCPGRRPRPAPQPPAWTDLANAILAARSHQYLLRRHARPMVYQALRARYTQRRMTAARAQAEAEAAELLSALHNRALGRVPHHQPPARRPLDLTPPSLLGEARHLRAVTQILLRRTGSSSRKRL